MSTFYLASDTIKCDCGKIINVKSQERAIKDTLNIIGFVPWEVTAEYTYECVSCGRSYFLSLYAELEEDEVSNTPNPSDFSIFGWDLEEHGVITVYQDNERYDLSGLKEGDTINLPDGSYILSQYEYVIENHTVAKVFGANPDENQLSLELDEVAYA